MIKEIITEEDFARSVEVISIGIIDEHTVLKQWYRKLGFTEVNRKKYDHLPFTVCSMEKRL
jgi:diamine N-acetyltransferase